MNLQLVKGKKVAAQDRHGSLVDQSYKQSQFENPNKINHPLSSTSFSCRSQGSSYESRRRKNQENQERTAAQPKPKKQAKNSNADVESSNHRSRYHIGESPIRRRVGTRTSSNQRNGGKTEAIAGKYGAGICTGPQRGPRPLPGTAFQMGQGPSPVRATLRLEARS